MIANVAIYSWWSGVSLSPVLRCCTTNDFYALRCIDRAEVDGVGIGTNLIGSDKSMQK